jgi:hypothetical protein
MEVLKDDVGGSNRRLKAGPKRVEGLPDALRRGNRMR